MKINTKKKEKKESKMENIALIIGISIFISWIVWLILTPSEIVEKRQLENQAIANKKADLKQLRSHLKLGMKIPFNKYDLIGHPETLPGTNMIYWIAYFPKADLTVWSKKEEDNKIVFRRNGRVPRRGFE